MSIISKHTVCRAAVVCALLIGLGFANAKSGLSAEVGDDGLHKQKWFTITFNDIAEDIKTAKADGKRLALIFEQRGCSYCKRLHERVFSQPDVVKFITENFVVVQMNLFGSAEVTDIDGTTLPEKEAAQRWRIMFTPTVLFLDDEIPQGARTARDLVVAEMPGAFEKGTVLHMFQWVKERLYTTDSSFQRYHARRLSEDAANAGN